ncbi:MAG: hypothetical protein MI685_03885 [Chlorobiales bacterium]|nr:hypothetical protein [Chlorobiales bacterium]
MKKSIRILLLIAGFVAVFPLQSCVVQHPVRPGYDFIWIAPHKAPGGILIPGHWKYVGPPRHRMAWVPGHYNRYGRWIPGHWKKLYPPRRGAYWIPGHRAHYGRWVPGHWRYR